MTRFLLIPMIALWIGADAARGQDAEKAKKSASAKAAARSSGVKAPPPVVAASAMKNAAKLRPDDQRRERMVYRIKHLPATDLAKTIESLLVAESNIGSGEQLYGRVAFIPEPISNSLIITGAPAACKEIEAIIAQLDRQPSMVSLNVVIAETTLEEKQGGKSSYMVIEAPGNSVESVIAELNKSGRLRVLANPQVMTLDKQPASIKLGRRIPQITGTTTSTRGKTNSVQFTDVGLSLGLTPRISSDGLVTMEIDVESSHFGPEEEGTLISKSDSGEEVRVAQTETTQIQTTVSAQSGQVLVLGGMTSKSSDKWTRLLIIVAPEVFCPDED